MNRMKPSENYFSQNSILDTFGNGNTLDPTWSRLTEDPKRIAEIPVIKVCFKNNKWFTLDNRRLWVFKTLEEDRYISDIELKIVSESELPESNFTTIHDGTSVVTRIKDTDDYFC